MITASAEMILLFILQFLIGYIFCQIDFTEENSYEDYDYSDFPLAAAESCTYLYIFFMQTAN